MNSCRALSDFFAHLVSTLSVSDLLTLLQFCLIDVLLLSYPVMLDRFITVPDCTCHRNGVNYKCISLFHKLRLNYSEGVMLWIYQKCNISAVIIWPHSDTLIITWLHDDVIKWKHFPRNWPFVQGIHRSPVNSPRKGQWRRAWCFLWSTPEQTLEETLETPVVWEAIMLIMTSLC